MCSRPGRVVDGSIEVRRQLGRGTTQRNVPWRQLGRLRTDVLVVPRRAFVVQLVGAADLDAADRVRQLRL